MQCTVQPRVSTSGARSPTMGAAETMDRHVKKKAMMVVGCIVDMKGWDVRERWVGSNDALAGVAEDAEELGAHTQGLYTSQLCTHKENSFGNHLSTLLDQGRRLNRIVEAR